MKTLKMIMRCTTAFAVMGNAALAGSAIAALPASQSTIRFDVVSIKHARASGGGFKLQHTANGFTARGVTPHMLIQEAYNIFDDARILGEMRWADKERYDIDAKLDSADAAKFRDMDLDMHRALLQGLLSDYFGLKVHKEAKVVDVYELLVGKENIKLDQATVAEKNQSGARGANGLVRRSENGYLAVEAVSMGALAQILSGSLGRPVVDKTGLSERYNFTLKWRPEGSGTSPNRESAVSAASSETMPDDAPSIFTALREQLGLRLQTAKHSMDALVIDQLVQPADN